MPPKAAVASYNPFSLAFHDSFVVYQLQRKWRWNGSCLYSVRCRPVSGASHTRRPAMKLTPNLITLFRIGVAFAAVCLYGRNPWANLIAVALTVAAIALDAFDGYIARRRNLATPLGAHFFFIGAAVTENVYFTYFAVVGLVSLWLPVLFFAR